MNPKIEKLVKQIEADEASLALAKFVICENAPVFEIALTLGGISASTQCIYLHPSGSAREYLSLFNECTFTRHSFDGATYHWATEYKGCALKVLCSEVVANANGTVVMP